MILNSDTCISLIPARERNSSAQRARSASVLSSCTNPPPVLPFYQRLYPISDFVGQRSNRQPMKRDFCALAPMMKACHVEPFFRDDQWQIIISSGWHIQLALNAKTIAVSAEVVRFRFD